MLTCRCLHFHSYQEKGGFPGSSAGKGSACNTGHLASISGLGRFPGEGIDYPLQYSWVPGGSDSKESACSVGDLGLIPGLGRSPGLGHGNPLQYSCLENPHGTGKPAWLQYTGSQRVGHNRATKDSTAQEKVTDAH